MHPTISSSVVPFSSCLQSFPATGSFPMSQLFASGDQSIGATASASVLPMNIQDWYLHEIFPSIRVFSNELFLCIRWPKYWNFSFSISPSNEYSGLISFRIDWFDLIAVWIRNSGDGSSNWCFRRLLWCTLQFEKHSPRLYPREGNGNPLQYSWLENPRDGGAWWAAVCEVAQSRIQPKRLSSRSNDSSNWETWSRYCSDLNGRNRIYVLCLIS